MSSPHGCPVFGLSALWRWVDANTYVMGAFLLLFGCILMEFGGRHPNMAMFVISTLFMQLIVLCLLFKWVLPHTTPKWGVWIMVIAAGIFGSGSGYGVYHWPKVGVVKIALMVGCILGSIIYVIFFSEIDKKLQHQHEMNIF